MSEENSSIEKEGETGRRRLWTEQHSKRLKIRITIQKEVHNVILEQKLVVTFVVTNQTCDECTKQVSNNKEASGSTDRRRIAYDSVLEQLMLNTVLIVTRQELKRHGDNRWWLDFSFESVIMLERSSLLEHAYLIKRLRPAAATHDGHSNEYSFKYTFLTEIVPVYRDDLIVMPNKTAKTLGDMGNLGRDEVAKYVHVIDPITMKRGEIDKKILQGTISFDLYKRAFLNSSSLTLSL